MRKLKLFMVACALVLGAGQGWADDVPFLREKDDFSGATVSSLTTFVPSGTTYTLELTGCVANQEITVPGGSFSYTPTTTGTVRFVRNGGDVVYVYEGTTYKGTVSVSAPADPTYPTGLTSASDKNLIQNGGFEDLTAGLFTGKSDRWKPTYWAAYKSDKTACGDGTSVRNYATIAGQKAMLMHDYGEGFYLTQQLPSGLMKNFTPYQISFKFRANTSDQKGAKYKFQVGNAEFNTDYYSSNETGASSNTETKTFTDAFITPATIVDQPYVQIFRSTDTNVPNLDYFDEFILVAANGGGIGITGATGATFLSGSAFAPIGAFGAATSYSLASTYATSLVINGTFESNVSGWNATGGFQNSNRANNQKGAFSGYFWENWNGSAKTNKMYQSVSDIPNGTYKLNICAFVNSVDAGKGQYVYANGNKTYVYTTTPTAYTVYTYVDNNTLEYGLNQSEAIANWMGIDNVSLEYCGASDVTTNGFKAIYDALPDYLNETTYSNIVGTERTNLRTVIEATPSATADGYAQATFNININAIPFVAAKENYDALVAEIAHAKTLGIATATADGYAATSSSTAATALTSTQNLKVAEYTHITTNYSESQSGRLGTWTEDFAEDLNGEGYVADGIKYWNEWGTNSRTGKQTVTLHAGDYAISCIGRGATGTSGYLYYKIGDADAVSVNFLMKGNRGRGVNTSGEADFSEEGEFNCDGAGFGWEYRFLTFTLAETTTVEIGVSATFASNWVSIYAPQLFSTEATAKSALLTDIAATLTTVPTSKMNSTVASTLSSKKEAAEGASSSNTVEELTTIYTELKDAIDDANASIEAYTGLKLKLDNVAAVVSSTNVYEASAYNSNYTDVLNSYMDNSITTDDANSYDYGTRVTGAMPAIMLSSWKVGETEALTDASLYMNTWSVEGNSDGSNMTTPFYEYYVNDANALTAKTFTATIEGLTASANYQVSMLVRVRQQDSQEKSDDDVTIQLSNGSAVNAADGTQSTVNTSMFYKTVYVKGTTDENGKLTITVTVKDGNHINWLAFKNVNYSLDETPTNEHKIALENAIAEAEGKNIGFEKDKYAPYTNKEALILLANAKAIDYKVNTDAEVVAATTALTGATWIENAEEVNAVSNELFSGTEYGTAGWTQNVTWNNVGGDGSYSIPAGTMTYGTIAYHEMPLKAATIYTLSFGHRTWDGSGNPDNGGTVSVLNENSDGLAATSYTGTSATTLQTETIDFLTGDAGNYTFTISAASGRLTFGNVTIKQAVAKPITISEEATSAPVFWLANATLTRTLSASYWNTFSVPFDMDIPAGWTVKEFKSAEENVITFGNAESIKAGKPYLVKPTENVVNPTFNGVIVKNTEGETVGEGAYKFAAQIYNKSLPTDGTIAYLSTDGKVKKLTSGGIKGLRAYFIIPAGESARIAFLDDDDQTTGISEMKQQNREEQVIYDLNGRRVKTMNKGIYVVNGKKIVK